METPVTDAKKEFATVLRRVPTYAIWDDHDYGPNPNSDGTAKGKAFGGGQIWANPTLGTTDTPGPFSNFSHGASWWTAATTALRTKFRITTIRRSVLMVTGRSQAFESPFQ